MKTRQIILASRPLGMPTLKSFRFEEKNIEELKAGEVLLKSWYISVDPYMRGRMNESKSYAKPYQVNEPFRGSIVARVEESRSNLLAENDLVVGDLPWMTYITVPAENLRKIVPGTEHAAYYLGILGMPGLTAYFGMMDIGKAKSGETVIVSGAAGAVGIVAGQIARFYDCKVIGIAGSDEKCGMLKSEFGFSEAINYKTERNIRKTLKTVCPDGVDIYFDNVGGAITSGVIDNLNFHSRVIVCGQISQYNNTRFNLVPDILPAVLTRSILVKGFIVRNYGDRYDEGYSWLTEKVKSGQLKYKQTIINGFDKLPETFLGLFSGINQGKLIVEV